jgi:hypothetical protein
MTEPLYTNRSYIGIVRTDVTLKAANRDVQRWDQLQTKATVRCNGLGFVSRSNDRLAESGFPWFSVLLHKDSLK